MRFRTAVIWNGVSQFGYSGITLLSTIILARMLTPDDFALIGLITVFIAFSQMMVDSEMGGALLRKKEVTRTDYSTLFYYNFAVSLVIYAIMYIAAPYIAKFYSLPQLCEVIRVISLTIVIHAFKVVQRIMIFRELKFKIYAIINVSSGLLSLALAIVMAKKGYGYWSLVWQQIAYAACHVVFMEIYNRFIPAPIFSIESFKYQFSFGISLLGSDAIRTIANNISTNIIGKIASLQFTGYYTQVSRITNFCQSSIGALMDQSVFPMLAKVEDPTSVRHTYYKILKLISLVLIAVTLIFIIFATPIIRLLLGEKWIDATWIFQILSIAILPTSAQTLCRNILKTIDKTKRVLHLETLKSALVISFLLLSALINTVCVVWAVVIAQVISCLCWLAVTEKELKLVCRNTNSID